MKLTLKTTMFATLAVGLMANAAMAGMKASSATLKLQNVVNNSIPASIRAPLQEKIEDIQVELTALDSSLEKLEHLVQNNVPEEYRETLNAKITKLKLAISTDMGGTEVEKTSETSAKRMRYFCTVTCKTSDGSFDLNRQSNAFGFTRQDAVDSASLNLQINNHCYYGEAVDSCEVTPVNN